MHLLENPSSGLQFMAEHQEELLGFATLYFTFSTLKVNRQAILNHLYVIPNARGQKIGEKLFQACLEYIRENEFASMTWETAKNNLVAQSFTTKWVENFQNGYIMKSVNFFILKRCFKHSFVLARQ
jgi:GNAT superfamily N-acetyltransferase